MYKEYHNVCPLVGIGTLPPPLSPASVPLPPRTKGGGGGTLARRLGVGGVPIPTTEEKLSTLPTLWIERSVVSHKKIYLKESLTEQKKFFDNEQLPN